MRFKFYIRMLMYIGALDSVGALDSAGNFMTLAIWDDNVIGH